MIQPAFSTHVPHDFQVIVGSSITSTVIVVFVLNLVFDHWNAFPRRQRGGTVETAMSHGAVAADETEIQAIEETPSSSRSLPHRPTSRVIRPAHPIHRCTGRFTGMVEDVTIPRTTRRSAFAALATAGLLAGSLAAPAVASAAPPATIALPDGIQPEGITSYGTTYWVGSLNDGRIVSGDLRGTTPARVLLPGAAGRQLRGLAFDSRTDLLWAVGNVGTVAHVYAVNAFSGQVVRDTVVPGGVFLNDLVVTPTAVWVTDSRVARLTRLTLSSSGRPTAVSPAFLPLRGAWPGGEAAGIASNGIRVVDADRVLLDHSGVGGLWNVDLRSGAATAVRVTGGPAITGGDGLERRGSTLWVVRGVSDTSVSQLQLTVTSAAVSATYTRTLAAASLDVPSTATSSGGALYAVNARFGVASPATATYSITRLAVSTTG